LALKEKLQGIPKGKTQFEETEAVMYGRNVAIIGSGILKNNDFMEKVVKGQENT
jgi:hypothetical protein